MRSLAGEKILAKTGHPVRAGAVGELSDTGFDTIGRRAIEAQFLQDNQQGPDRIGRQLVIGDAKWIDLLAA